MDQVDRFNELSADVDAQAGVWAGRRHERLAAHAAAAEALAAELEGGLLVERERREKAERDVAGAQAEWEETQRQMEVDLDGEIEVRGAVPRPRSRSRVEECACRLEGGGPPAWR
jgi:hypothetical protein